jgi:predicted ATPase/DNA-binding SARP family transcriptional activator
LGDRIRIVTSTVENDGNLGDGWRRLETGGGAVTSGAHLELKLLGGFEARLQAGAALVLPTQKTQALLAYLALPLGQSHLREKLATLLWGDMQHAQARSNLRNALSRIKKVLPKAVRASLVVDGASVSLDPSAVDVDVTQFERLLADGSVDGLGQGTTLYRGDLLAGLVIAERPFEEWLTAERQRLHELAIQGLDRLLTHQQKAGDTGSAVQTGLRLLALDALQEPVHRAVMRLYARLGRREAALRQYQLCMDALRRELSTPPEAETTQLYQHILKTPSARPGRPEESSPASEAAPPPAAPPPTNLPASTSPLIGRAAVVAEVREMLGGHRLVTLIGAGGIGKTRLSLEVARQLLPHFADGVWSAELAPLADASLVPVTVAVSLKLGLPDGAESPERVAAALGAKRLLLVLDNCEHVIEAAARMAEAVLRAAPHARVVATSREPLRAPGEYVYRVPSLEVPREDTDDREELLQTAAVSLFVARVRAVEARFSPDARSAATMGAVCRRLDGIPLAIELAASRTATLGLDEVATRLDDRFRVLTGGHRTALPRQQTLRATLDWSYELLVPIERTVLHRLAIFAGGFTLEAAGAVATAEDLDASTVVDVLTNLAAKSLLVVEIADADTRYRLLETTRAYALEKLTDSGEFDQVVRRHALHYQDLFERADTEWKTRPALEWLAVYGPQIDNVRTALDWAFSSSGDASIGVALTASALPLWFHQSLLVECRGRVERALASLAERPGRDRRREMQLRTALLVALMHTRGATPEIIAALTTALDTAEECADEKYQLQALWGLWLFRISSGEARTALALAERFCGLVTNPADRFHGERMVGASLHLLGDHANARRILEDVLDRYVAAPRLSHAAPFQYDHRYHRVNARMLLSRILWLQGFPEQARQLAERNVEDASALDHAVLVCNALETACLIALWSGDLVAAEHYVTALLDHSARHAMTVRHQGARWFNGARLLKRGEIGEGLALLRSSVDHQRGTSHIAHYPVTLGTLAQGLAEAGYVAQALETIDEALIKSERDEERWWIAEFLRIKAELTLLAGGTDAAPAAEAHLQDALAWTRRQGALSLELRCATDLARLWHHQRRTRPARDLLAPIYARFTEGFATEDLKAAKALLSGLG